MHAIEACGLRKTPRNTQTIGADKSTVRSGPANEYFCLTVARKYGLDVPPYRLAEDGMALVIDRFDLRMTGSTVALVANESINQHFKSPAENFCRW